MELIHDVISQVSFSVLKVVAGSQNGGSSSIPANALLNDDGSPILNDDGSYILTGD